MGACWTHLWVRKLCTISVQPSADGTTQCNCVVDAHGRLKRACRCSDGSGVITFHTEDGVGQLTTNLRNHRSEHEDGFHWGSDRDPNGFINFCENCCLFNRQVLHSKATRRTASSDRLQLPGNIADRVIEPERIKAVTVILSAMLRGQNLSLIHI